MRDSADPWREKAGISDKPDKLFFEDSFAEIVVNDDRKYVPLDDSQKYLAGLEKKLAHIQGKTQTGRDNERKRLISALALSKETHAVNFMNTNFNCSLTQTQFEECYNSHQVLYSGATVDPPGTLGYLLKKCAPDHIALSAEELTELTKSDVLAKVHESLYSDGDADDKNIQTKDLSSAGKSEI